MVLAVMFQPGKMTDTFHEPQMVYALSSHEIEVFGHIVIAFRRISKAHMDGDGGIQQLFCQLWPAFHDKTDQNLLTAPEITGDGKGPEIGYFMDYLPII